MQITFPTSYFIPLAKLFQRKHFMLVLPTIIFLITYFLENFYEIVRKKILLKNSCNKIIRITNLKKIVQFMTFKEFDFRI